MKKGILIIALLLIAAGIALAAVGGFAMGFDFKKLDNHQYTERSVEINETFENVSFDGGTLRILPSEDGKCRAEFVEGEKVSFSADVENGTLNIVRMDERKWLDYIGFNFSSYTATLYLPQAEYDALTVHTSSGNVEVADDFVFKSADIKISSGNMRFYADVRNDLTAKCTSGSVEVSGANARSISISSRSGSVKLADIDAACAIGMSCTSGSVRADNVSCEGMEIRSSSGSIKLNSVIASGEMKIKSTSGNVEFGGCDAGSFSIDITSGGVRGTLLNDKIFDVHSTSGSINVPPSVDGCGVFSARVTSGNINIGIQK